MSEPKKHQWICDKVRAPRLKDLNLYGDYEWLAHLNERAEHMQDKSVWCLLPDPQIMPDGKPLVLTEAQAREMLEAYFFECSEKESGDGAPPYEV